MSRSKEGTVLRCTEVLGDTAQLRMTEDGRPFLDVRSKRTLGRITVCLAWQDLAALHAEIGEVLLCKPQ